MALEFVLDTNGYSAFFRGNGNIRIILERADKVLIPSIVAGELFSGFNQGNRREVNYAEFNHFIELPGIALYPVGKREAELYGQLVMHLRKAGTPIPTNDLWIAASALSLGASLLTNDRHFDVIAGLDIRNY